MPSLTIPSLSKLGTNAHTDRAPRSPYAQSRPPYESIQFRAAVGSNVTTLLAEPVAGSVRSLPRSVPNLHAKEQHAAYTSSVHQQETGPLTLPATSVLSSQAIPDETPKEFSSRLQVGTFGECVTQRFNGREMAHSSSFACLSTRSVSNARLSQRSVSNAEQSPSVSPSRNVRNVQSWEVPPRSVSNATLSLRSVPSAEQSLSVSPSRNVHKMSSCELAPQFVSEQPPLRLVIFDFDCTLTVYHVFASLAGIATANMTLPVPPPHARSERGQLLRLAELDADPVWGPAGFALRAFGGATRVAQLRNVLQVLADKGIECIICSKGYAGPIRKCLDQVKLLSFFTEVFGTLGTSICTSDYDQAAYTVDARNVQRHESNANTDVRDRGVVPKSEAIAKFVKERGLNFSQVAFLDDQIDEIKLAANVCRTFYVPDGNVCAAMSSLMACM